MSLAKAASILFVSALAFANAVPAQSPAPIVVQAASPTVGTSTAPAPTAQGADSLQAAIKLLEQMKAANDEILNKQKAALERLGEMQQAADQLKIFTKRG